MQSKLFSISGLDLSDQDVYNALKGGYTTCACGDVGKTGSECTDCAVGYTGSNCDACADGYTGYPDCAGIKI